jgi:hypothetical protein
MFLKEAEKYRHFFCGTFMSVSTPAMLCIAMRARREKMFMLSGDNVKYV